MPAGIERPLALRPPMEDMVGPVGGARHGLRRQGEGQCQGSRAQNPLGDHRRFLSPGHRSGGPMNVVARYRFLVLLVSLVLLIVISPIFHESFSSRLAFAIFGSTVILAAIVSILVDRRGRLTALVLGLPLLAGL